ncbi:MAG TPA: methionyl-tRNA formyltransferase [Acidimicrobiales bacterium]|nr:methionyl-tRNA formyltransferase [Acidimicrobiales bacterium]
MARLAYLGTPDLAVPPLRALVDAGHEVVLVVTRPDRRRGRGSQLSPSPVKRAATELAIPVTEQVDDVVGAGAELGVVVAFGRIIKPHVLAALPMVNLHFSLLPRWRGAAPLERAILAGDTETGVCLMAVEEGLDTGAVYDCRRLAIGEQDTLEDLRHQLSRMGAELLVERLAGGVAGLGLPVAQEGEATYAPKLDPAELRIDWSQDAARISRVVRLGGAWTTFRGRRLRILQARPVADGPEPGRIAGVVVGAGAGGVELVVVQPEGRAAMPATEWARGARPGPDDVLGG